MRKISSVERVKVDETTKAVEEAKEFSNKVASSAKRFISASKDNLLEEITVVAAVELTAEKIEAKMKSDAAEVIAEI